MISQALLTRYARSTRDRVREHLLWAAEADQWVTVAELKRLVGGSVWHALYYWRDQGYRLCKRTRAGKIAEYQLRKK